MSRQHILQVFTKDGLEILRDRRTLFVNIVLPILLYPLMVLFGLQVYQLTLMQKQEKPLLMLVDVPGELGDTLGQAPSGRQQAPLLPAPGVRASEPPREGLQTVLATGAQEAPLRLAGEQEWEQPAPPPGQAPAPPDAAGVRIAESVRSKALEALRENHAVAALVRLEDRLGVERLALVQDDANRHADEVTAAVLAAVRGYSDKLVARRLAAAHLPPTTAYPLQQQVLGVAPRAEALRTHLSSMLPLLLVVLAASGAFFPRPLDLLSGERERGTLESLLSFPVRRRDIFLGKLLVACTAAAASVLLNLISVGTTVVVFGHHLAGSHGEVISGLFSLSAGTLVLCAIVLLPLTVTLAATALATTGLASTAKEAQNYLTPFFLVVFVLAMVCVIPGTKPSVLLDLVPVVGPVLTLKESLQAEHLPWVHLGVTTLASLALAWVVVGWSTRLLEDEHFRYPTLVRAGWGRFRRWGVAPEAAGGLEAMALYAVAVGLYLLLTLLCGNLPIALRIAVPLLGFVAVALVHNYLGAYRLRTNLSLRLPGPRSLLCGLGLVPCAIILSIALQALYTQLFGSEHLEGSEKLETLLSEFRARDGMLAVVAVVGLLPGLCEEIFFRGSMLSGLRRGIGPIGAICVSSFLFAATHGEPDRFLPQMMLGVMLAVLVVRTGSVIPGMMVHALYNAAVVLLDAYGVQIAERLHLPLQSAVYLPLGEALVPIAGVAAVALLVLSSGGGRPREHHDEGRTLPA